MKKYAILVIALMVLIGFTVVSCASSGAHHHKDKMAKSECKCPAKEMGEKCTGNDGKLCPTTEGKESCQECQDKTAKMTEKEEAEDDDTAVTAKQAAQFQKMITAAMTCMEKKDYPNAITALKEIDKQFPNQPEVNYNLVCVYSLTGDKTNAIATLHKAVPYGWADWKHMDQDTDLDNIRNEAEYQKIRTSLGVIFSDTCACNKDEHNEAHKTETPAQAEAPKEPMTPEQMQADYQSQMETELKYLSAKDYDKGVAILNGLDKKYPNNVLINYNLGCAFSLMGNKAEAICSLHKAMQCGWADWKHMDGDTDLDNIRAEGEYKKLRDALEVLNPEGVMAPPCSGNCPEKASQPCPGNCKDKEGPGKK